MTSGIKPNIHIVQGKFKIFYDYSDDQFIKQMYREACFNRLDIFANLMSKIKDDLDNQTDVCWFLKRNQEDLHAEKMFAHDLMQLAERGWETTLINTLNQSGAKLLAMPRLLKALRLYLSIYSESQLKLNCDILNLIQPTDFILGKMQKYLNYILSRLNSYKHKHNMYEGTKAFGVMQSLHCAIPFIPLTSLSQLETAVLDNEGQVNHSLAPQSLYATLKQTLEMLNQHRLSILRNDANARPQAAYRNHIEIGEFTRVEDIEAEKRRGTKKYLNKIYGTTISASSTEIVRKIIASLLTDEMKPHHAICLKIINKWKNHLSKDAVIAACYMFTKNAYCSASFGDNDPYCNPNLHFIDLLHHLYPNAYQMPFIINHPKQNYFVNTPQASCVDLSSEDESIDMLESSDDEIWQKSYAI